MGLGKRFLGYNLEELRMFYGSKEFHIYYLFVQAFHNQEILSMMMVLNYLIQDLSVQD